MTAMFPSIDATRQDCITEEQAQFFRENGLLVIRNVLRGEELRAMQEQTGVLVARAATSRVDDPDFFYTKHELTGATVPFRIEYVIDKTEAGKALLGHPFILRTVEKLQGRNFIPTWDTCVFKNAGAGAAIKWHRDAGTDNQGDTPIFNVDFYLDQADITNCLWGIPGSNRWTTEQAAETIARLNADGFQTTGAIPIPMNPGDVMLHNILVLHGSPPCHSPLRRVVYYEFRSIETELILGPHTPEYIPLKQRLLLACLRRRAAAPYARGERPFTYQPDPAYIPPPLRPGEDLETYRYPHNKFWRS